MIPQIGTKYWPIIFEEALVNVVCWVVLAPHVLQTRNLASTSDLSIHLLLPV